MHTVNINECSTVSDISHEVSVTEGSGEVYDCLQRKTELLRQVFRGLKGIRHRGQNMDHLNPHPALELRAPNSLRFIDDEIFD